MRNENAQLRRKVMALSLAVLAVRVAHPALAQTVITYQQNSGDNNWNQAAVYGPGNGTSGIVLSQASNWNTSYYPGQTSPAYSFSYNSVTYTGPVDPTPTTDNVVIPALFSVNDNAGNLTMASLNLGSGASVGVNAGLTFTITGNVIDNGTVVINNNNNNAATIISVGGTLSGTGDIYLQHGGTYSQLNGTLTQASGHSISGVGNINATLTNQGFVNANVSGQTLLVDTSASNTGTFEATGGGILQISGITVTQSGPGVFASNASNVTITNSTITGGAISSPASGNVYITGTSTFNAITSTAAVNIPAGNQLNITGGLADSGTILINNDVNNAVSILNVSGGTISGNGTFILNHGSYSQINGAFTQSAGHTIDGSGIVNAALVNNGVVNANSGITLQTSNMSNNATFEATGGGTLAINGITVTQSAAGVTAANASTVTFTNATLNGGMIASPAAGTVYIYGTSTFNAITSTAAVNILAGNQLNITGGLADTGTILINGDGNNSVSILNVSGGTVSGIGTFILNHGGYSQINGSFTQSAGHTINGYGIVNAALVNNGVVNANSGITLQTSNMSNNATFEATNGGTLSISGITVTQGAAGVINASTGSAVTLSNTGIVNGTLTSPPNTANASSPSNAGNFYAYGVSSLSNVSNSAYINIPNNNTLNIIGNLVDNGTIVINSDANNAVSILNVSGGTVSGPGTFILNHGGYSQINGAFTQSAGHTINGYGIVNAALVNNGVVNANSGIALQTSNMSNNATFEATGGGTLSISGITVTQGAAGVINASTGSAVTLSNTGIVNGTLTSSPNTANASSPSNAGNFYAYGVSSLSNVSNSAYINIPNNNTLNIIGNLIDNGTILINSDASNAVAILNVSGGTVSGTGTFILNHYGSYGQLNGVLTQSAGHSISGVGTINAVLTNNGLVNSNVPGQVLYVEAPSLINNSVLESTNGATLYFDNSVKVNNSAGMINASSGGISLANGTSITGGILNAVSPNVFTVSSYNATAGYSANLTALNVSTGTQVNLQNGNTLSINGPTFRDNGLIVVNFDNNNAESLVQFNSNTLLTGNGTIFLQHGGSYSVVGTAAGVTLTQDVSHTIDGLGQITAQLVNNGTVNANSNGNPLQLLTSNMSNTGTFEATSGGVLIISGITVTQTGAGVTASNASNVTFSNATLSGGLLSSPALGNVYISGTSTFNAITSSAAVNIPAGNQLNIIGNLVDTGTTVINNDANNSVSTVNVSGGIVSGTGTFILNHYGYSQINGSLTQSAGHTINGFGNVNATLTNNGTVNANVNGQALYLLGTSSGTGTYQASNGGTLVVGANVTISNPGSLVGAGASSPIVINSAVSLIDNGSVAGLPAISDNGSLTFGINPGTGFYVRSLTSLSIASGATATVVSSSNTSNRTLLVTSGLSFAGGTNNWGGLLNLGNNDMDVVGGSLANITNQISEGYNGGNWQGPAGITSSAAAASIHHLMALGVIQNNQSGTALFTATHQFDGTTPGATDVLVKYTYYGDANLDGKVDGSDYSLIDNGFKMHLTGWFNGDFNFDGVVNGSDYTLIDNVFNTQGVQITAAVATPTAQVAGTAVVPEPATVGLVLIPLVGLLGRRRQQ